ncbi:hypothetical protein [Sansalvadorimonas verongulae]|uniref:hypothetical protein n=1 Tax=Sansalvadorimonas verongulae TaxID=2172824 RepID=UPI0012BD59B9|nr:hypothetical protein [Sansalvadorimonas verongulae]MTI13539.1 hypothetical protein [Sansalvadorimonas verongulae]
MSLPNINSAIAGTPNSTAAGVCQKPLTFLEKMNLAHHWNGFKNFCEYTAKPKLIAFSASAPAPIKSLQSWAVTHAEGVLPGLKAFASTTATTVGTTDIPMHVAGAGAGVGLLAATPVLGAICKAGSRTLRGMLQNRTNDNVLRDVHALPSTDLQAKMDKLEGRAKTLEDRALKQRNVAGSDLGWWGLIKYAGTFITPVLVAPQIGTLISLACPVSTPAVLPIALGVGAGLCGIRFITARFDAWREKIQANETMEQAAVFRLAAEDCASAIQDAKDSSDKDAELEELRAQIDEGAEVINELTQTCNRNKTSQEELVKDHQETMRKLDTEKTAHTATKDAANQSNVLFTETSRQLEEEKKALQQENTRLLEQLEARRKDIEDFKTAPEIPADLTNKGRLSRRHSLLEIPAFSSAQVTASVNPQKSLYLSLTDDSVNPESVVIS